MPHLTRRRFAALTLALPALTPGPAASQAGGAPGRPLLVFAAASLQSALTAVAAAWQSDTGQRVSFSFAASSAMARQIEQGAPADLFASADLEWMDWAQARRLVRPESRVAFLGNTLVLVEAADQPPSALAVAPGFALAAAIGDSRLATGHPQGVPVGRYAQAALTALGVWDEVRPRLAGADNVRAALALVARGEARFGIVYATDARADPRVRVVGTFPPESHPPIVYPFALTSAATHPDAGAFLAFLRTPAALQIFEAQGFTVAR